MTKRPFKTQSLALLLALGTPALATAREQQEGVEGSTQEFFFSEEAPPNQKQELEAGSGLDWEQDDGEARFQVPLHVEYGLTDRFQLQGAAELSPEGEGSAFEEGRVGARWALLNDGERGVAVSAGAHVLAVRDAPDASLRPGLAPFLLAYKDLGALGLNASAGVDVLPASGGSESTVSPDLGLGVVLGRGVLRPRVEAALRDEQGTHTGILAPGLAVRPSKSVEVGVSVPWRLAEGGDRGLGVSALLIWNGGGSR